MSKIFIWHEGDTNPFLNLTTTSTTSVSVFAARSGEVFAGILNTMNASRLHKWAVNATTSTLFATTATLSYGLFIDDADRLYYSLGEASVVNRMALDGSLNSTVAGTGTAGNSPTQLIGPAGIFVTANFNLYVADFGNNRIQMFPTGQMTATTVAGVTASGTITLAGPKGVVIDADGYLFIADQYYNRVVGQGPSGFRCIVGCTFVNGSAPHQLSVPSSLSFDSHGNIFVVDTGNRRVQKFLLATNSCGE